MSAGTPDSIIERIRRIKALTESSNENEAAVAAAKLSQMLQEHDLTMADIETGPEDPVTEIAVDSGSSDKHPERNSVRQPWRTTLAGNVASVTFCETLYGKRWVEPDPAIPGSKARIVSKVYFIGHKHDAEVAVYLYQTLAAKIDELATRRTGEYVKQFTEEWGASPFKIGGEHHPTIYRNSWLRGALHTIGRALWDQYSSFKTSSPSAMAMIKVKDDAVSTFVKAEHPLLGHFHSHSNGSFNYSAYEQGKADGAGIHASRGLNKSTGAWQGQLGKGGSK